MSDDDVLPPGDEPAAPGWWRVFGSESPRHTRIITPEGGVLQGVIDVEWSQSATGTAELRITIRGGDGVMSPTSPPTITCQRCCHEHVCETEAERGRASLMTSLGSGRPIPLAYGSPTYGGTVTGTTTS